MVHCLVGVGSNLGNRRNILDRAVEQLGISLEVLAVSDWHSYPSIGPAADGTDDQPDFLNGVLLVDSPLPPQETANVLHELERAAGRDRVIRWSSRTLDADLLTYGDQIVHTESLQVPHPRMMSRRFVLEPACDIAADTIHPAIGWSMRKLLQHLCDAKPYFVTIGSDAKKVERITQRLASETNGRFHSIDRSAFLPSSSRDQLVQSVAEKLTTVANEIHSGAVGPWFSNFWIGEFDSLLKPKAYHPDWNPKLVLVTEAVRSEFANNLARKLEQATVPIRVPLLFLSSDENDAWQDAFGAVQGMR